ncbi:MAG TPA: isoprenylcysteine carboxylmethyltransferase family protein [Chitinophagaceae bacterium]|nr:isoprenylcysteine carboxylmethyltransferase family protein [Chitinophagaceae bacterium]
MINHIILALFWITYCLIHSVLAAVSVKNYFERVLVNSFKYYRLAYNLIAFITLIPIIIFQFWMRQVFVFNPTIITTVIGFVLSISGAFIMIMMIWKYFLQMIGIKLKMEKPVVKLEVSGLHKYVRHPLYLGTFMFIWGLFFIFPWWSGLIACAIITIYTLIAIKYEEEKLILEFGEDYKAYKSRVPMILPFLF